MSDSSPTPVLGFQEAASHANHSGRRNDPDGQAEWRRAAGGVCYQPLWALYPGEAVYEDQAVGLVGVARDRHSGG